MGDAMKKPIAVLMGVDQQQTGRGMAQISLQELAQLADTAGIEVGGMMIQARPSPDKKTYIGSGKCQELVDLIEQTCAQLVIADDELSPLQQKTCESMFQVKVMDRTGLILDIFAQRARSYEAQLQVECAQLQYLLPRLSRMWTHLSRLGGGIGTRGPGEKQLEVDKRQIRKRLSVLKRELNGVEQHRQRHRERRKHTPILTAAIVGYTNAGKSTLMRTLTQAQVLVEDKLFATLDPTTRRLDLPSKQPLLITDTVGFIQKLPHQLIDAFTSTLEEALHADFLIHVVDVSDANATHMVETSQALLERLGVEDKPMLTVMTRADRLGRARSSLVDDLPDPKVLVNARDPRSIEPLVKAMDVMLAGYAKRMTFYIPYNRMDVVDVLHQYGHIEHEDYAETITLVVTINRIIGDKIMGQLNKPVAGHG